MTVDQSQSWWQTIPHGRTAHSEGTLAELSPCSSHNSGSGGRRSQLTLRLLCVELNEFGNVRRTLAVYY